MYGILVITAPNGEKYEIDGEDLFEIADRAETAYANRGSQWATDAETARKLCQWIAHLPLQHEAPGSWMLSGKDDD